MKPAAKRIRTPATEPATILVVDDNRFALACTTRALTGAGYRVLEAGNGTDALALAREHRPALVLLDAMMPGMNGGETLARLRADPELVSTSVVMLSASHVAPEDQAAGLDAGADGYLAQPIDNREFLARVRAHLRQRELLDALRRSETRFRATFDQTAVGIAHVAPSGRLLDANRRLCGLLGRDATALRAMRWRDLVHPDDVDRYRGEAKRLIDGEVDAQSLELRCLRHDRTPVWVTVTVALVRTEDGAPDFFVVVVADIGERRRAEAALRETEAALARAQRLAGLGTWEVDLATGEISRSDEAQRLVAGLACADSGTFDDYLAASHPDDRARLSQAWEALAHGTASLELEHRLVWPDGRERWLRLQGMPVRDELGRVVRFTGTALDITERRRAQEQIAAQLGELKRWQAVTMGREERVQALKAEVNALLARAGLPPRYPSAAPAHASPDAPSTSGETIA